MASITLSWNANPATDNVTDYLVFGANGTSVAFGSCSLLATVNALTWTDTGLANGQARTYYIEAVNAAGDSSAEGPLNITAASLSASYVQNAGDAPSIQEGAAGSLPSAGTAGRLYVETDNKILVRDNGSSWDTIGGSGDNPTATAADTAVNGSATTFMRSDGAPAVQKASSSQFGIVKVDGSTITASGGVISAVGGGGGSGAVVLISSQTPSGTGTVTFSAISSSYQDLEVRIRGSCTASATYETVNITVNGDTGSHYDSEQITMNNGSNTSTGLDAQTSLFAGWLPAANAPANSQSGIILDIMNYKDTNLWKSFHSRGGVRLGSGASNLYATDVWGDWQSTSAITSVTVTLASGNFATGSVVSLYGRV